MKHRSISHRCVIVMKLRIRAYKLEIENGRYGKKPVTDRLCKECFQNKVEDVAHFICDCSCYDSERFKLFDFIKHEIPNFVSLNIETCEHSEILNRFAEFIYTFFLNVNLPDTIKLRLSYALIFKSILLDIS